MFLNAVCFFFLITWRILSTASIIELSAVSEPIENSVPGMLLLMLAGIKILGSPKAGNRFLCFSN